MIMSMKNSNESAIFRFEAQCLNQLPHRVHLNNYCNYDKLNLQPVIPRQPVRVAARSEALVCDRSPAVTVGSNPVGVMDICLL